MLAVAAGLLIAAQPAPPPSADLSPEERAAALAVTTFAFACVGRVGVSASLAEFAAASDGLGRKLADDFPADRGAVRVDGADGRGCRVAYTGPRAPAVWAALSGVVAGSKTTPDGGGCVVRETTPDRIAAACTDTSPGGPRRSDMTIARSSAAPTATITATLALRTP